MPEEKRGRVSLPKIQLPAEQFDGKHCSRRRKGISSHVQPERNMSVIHSLQNLTNIKHGTQNVRKDLNTRKHQTHFNHFTKVSCCYLCSKIISSRCFFLQVSCQVQKKNHTDHQSFSYFLIPRQTKWSFMDYLTSV